MSGEGILVVDDETDLAASCQRLLESKGYEAAAVASGEAAMAYIQEEDPQLVITDLKMPGMDGMELLQWIRETQPEIQVIMMTAFSTVEHAVAAIRFGATDFVPKPFTPDHLMIVVEKALTERALREENRRLKEQLTQQYSFDNIVGKSPQMSRIFEAIRKIADTPINVLVCGGSGTGKELIARSIHANGVRSAHPFVPLNCGALPEHLVESEIFGHEKGAFTGAARAKPGLLEFAHGGTFFMDEISELPPALQVKFLRVLEDGRFRRVGSNVEREVDIRLISATNTDLEDRVEAGAFREDLYYRINSFTITIPPLRERPDDIPLLVNHFLRHYGKRNQREVGGVSPEAMELLLNHEWKGNVRELEHAIEHALVLVTDDEIQPGDLPQNLQKEPGRAALPQTYLELPFKEAKEHLVEDFERRYIVEVLRKYEGNISRSASHSGIDRRSLHRLLAKYHIDASQVGKNGPANV